ncbi:MAG: 50S ribosomal protein L32 [Spirochaetia bacterium]|nr:50S ribosomal protein L32 [Spirochaetia bacterium]
MAVPKRKTSRSRKLSRRAHHALGKPNLRPCPNCGTFGLPHRVCSNCGMYKERLVLIPKVKKVKDENKSA